MLHQSGLVLFRRDLPELLQADAVFLRLAVLAELTRRDQLCGQRAARALGEQRVFGAQLHAARERILVLPILADTHVAGRDADNPAAVAVEDFGSRKARIDLKADR